MSELRATNRIELLTVTIMPEEVFELNIERMTVKVNGKNHYIAYDEVQEITDKSNLRLRLCLN